MTSKFFTENFTSIFWNKVAPNFQMTARCFDSFTTGGDMEV